MKKIRKAFTIFTATLMMITVINVGSIQSFANETSGKLGETETTGDASKEVNDSETEMISAQKQPDSVDSAQKEGAEVVEKSNIIQLNIGRKLLGIASQAIQKNDSLSGFSLSGVENDVYITNIVAQPESNIIKLTLSKAIDKNVKFIVKYDMPDDSRFRYLGEPISEGTEFVGTIQKDGGNDQEKYKLVIASNQHLAYIASTDAHFFEIVSPQKFVNGIELGNIQIFGNPSKIVVEIVRGVNGSDINTEVTLRYNSVRNEYEYSAIRKEGELVPSFEVRDVKVGGEPVDVDVVPKPQPEPPAPSDPQPQPQPQPPAKDSTGRSGGGSAQSSVRPGPAKSEAGKGQANKTVEKKEVKKAENQKDRQKTETQPQIKEDSKVSTKLSIGEKSYTVVIDGQKVEKTMDVSPRVHQGRTVLPARMISEILGVDVKYEAQTKTASFMYGEGNKVELQLGQKYMTVNGQKVALTADILNVNGRILLPLTDIQKAFVELGLTANVSWDAQTKSVTIEK